MLKPTDIRVGNLIQYDHDERRQPPVCMQRGWVKEIHTDYVVLTNGEKRKWERTEGLPLTDDLLIKVGWVWNPDSDSFEKYPNGDVRMHLKRVELNSSYTMYNHVLRAIIKERIWYFHQLQNVYYNITDGQELEITVPEPPPIHPQQ